MSFKIFCLGLLALLMTSCISGAKNPDQTFSEKLNADSYESSNTVMGVPVLTRKPLTRRVTGTVQCGDGLTQRPANHAAITLTDGNKVISSTSTDAKGSFVLLVSVAIDRTYQLKASSKCGTSAQDISLKEDSNHSLFLKN